MFVPYISIPTDVLFFNEPLLPLGRTSVQLQEVFDPGELYRDERVPAGRIAPGWVAVLIRAFLKRNRRLTLERLPAYAPDLNPAETVWWWLKYGQLANFVPDGVTDLDDEVVERLVALKFTPALLRKLWEGSDLPYPKRE